MGAILRSFWSLLIDSKQLFGLGLGLTSGPCRSAILNTTKELVDGIEHASIMYNANSMDEENAVAGAQDQSLQSHTNQDPQPANPEDGQSLSTPQHSQRSNPEESPRLSSPTAEIKDPVNRSHAQQPPIQLYDNLPNGT